MTTQRIGQIVNFTGKKATIEYGKQSIIKVLISDLLKNGYNCHLGETVIFDLQKGDVSLSSRTITRREVDHL